MIALEIDRQSETALLVRLRQAEEAGRRGLERGINQAAIYLAGYIKANLLTGQVLKNRTGNLRRAVFSRLEGAGTANPVGVVAVGAEAPYGRFHEYGVGHPWEIRPRRKKVLAFEVNGETVFARRVTHPGLRERSFMRRGLREAQPRILRIIQQAVAAGMRAA